MTAQQKGLLKEYAPWVAVGLVLIGMLIQGEHRFVTLEQYRVDQARLEHAFNENNALLREMLKEMRK